MNYILFDDESRDQLLPFTFTRPVAEIRTGILTIREKWEKYFSQSFSFVTEKYLSEKFPVKIEKENLLINGSVFPDHDLKDAISKLKLNQQLRAGKILIAVCLSSEGVSKFNYKNFTAENIAEYKKSIMQIKNLWDIFSKNEKAIGDDFALLTKGRKSRPVSDSNKIIGKENIFIENEARMEYTILNASAGSIYIGNGAEVMEGAMIRGPFSLGEHSTLKLGAKIYGATTIGPHCKVGGEVTNSVIFGYSNKAHDGFLGNSVIGEWCNLGADTNNSNLKNNYSEVQIWNYASDDYIKTGLEFCGLFMGDHSKCSINTMFNTGTVAGVSANIFGSGFPPKKIPSFGWGGSEGFTVYKLSEAINTAKRVYERRNMNFSQSEEKIFKHLFEMKR